MLDKSAYIYNLNANDIYCYNQYGQAYFDEKYKGNDVLSVRLLDSHTQKNLKNRVKSKANKEVLDFYGIQEVFN